MRHTPYVRTALPAVALLLLAAPLVLPDGALASAAALGGIVVLFLLGIDAEAGR